MTVRRFLFIVFLFLFVFVNPVNAQVTSSGLSTSTPVNDSEAQDGDIICAYKEGNKRCTAVFDSTMFGIVTTTPAISVEDPEMKDAKFVITQGVASVRVTSANGAIKEGDFITTSTVPGVGQKADRNGYVVGRALENWETSDTQSIGKIQIEVNIHAAIGLSGSRGNLLQFIREGVAVPLFEPLESLRYLLAVAIILVSFTLGMIYFGRASKAGIEAIGRNPLAKKTIQFTVLVNIILTLVIVLVGLGIAYLILML